MIPKKHPALKKVLTIAGSDSGGGAGIQADLKTFAARGVYGMSVITAVTAQNTTGVDGIFELPAGFVGQQIESVLSDIGADTVKIGMLSNKKIVKVIAAKLKKYKIQLIILDPVMIAKSGDALLKKDARAALKKYLIPQSYLITPNIPESEELTHSKIENVEEMKKAAALIRKLGAQNVLVKGGHLNNEKKSIDILFDGRKFHEFAAPRIITANTHGTGCTLSSAIAAELAHGNNLIDAVKNAKKYLSDVLKGGQNLKIGAGHGPLNHIMNLRVKK